MASPGPSSAAQSVDEPVEAHLGCTEKRVGGIGSVESLRAFDKTGGCEVCELDAFVRRFERPKLSHGLAVEGHDDAFTFGGAVYQR